MARKNKEPKVKKVKEQKVKKSKKTKTVEPLKNRIIGNPVRVLLIMAVISVIIGLALYLFYDEYYNYFDFIIGGIIALIGLVNIAFYFGKKMIDGVFRSEFAIGVFCIAVGVYVALNGGASFSFLVVIGALCALDGIIKLQYTLDLARMRFGKWWIALIFAVFGMALGVIVLMGILNDIFGTDAISYTGIALCANAVFDVVVAIVIAIRNKKALKAKNAAAAAPETPAAELSAEEAPALSAEEPAAEVIEEAPVFFEGPAEEVPAAEEVLSAESVPEADLPAAEEPAAE